MHIDLQTHEVRLSTLQRINQKEMLNNIQITSLYFMVDKCLKLEKRDKNVFYK